MTFSNISFGIGGKFWAGIFVVIVIVAIVIYLSVEDVISMNLAYMISGVTIGIFILALIRARSEQPL